ncbi:hypothetical protein MMC34_008621 [Xylographa carneopallida]|nr:hypothetical protein [Xylographa carneopallida]
MSAPGQAGDAQADWYNHFDAQFEELLSLRDQPQQQHQPPPPPVAAAASEQPVARRAARLTPVASVAKQPPPAQLRPQSSQSSQRRRSNGGSRRTHSELPQLSEQRSPPQRVSAGGVPAEFRDMVQQQEDGKQRAAAYKRQRRLEKAERKAEEEARRAEHRAKMKAIQLRSAASSALSACASPVDTPSSSRPASRSERSRQPQATRVTETPHAATESGASPASLPSAKGACGQRLVAVQSAPVAPLPSQLCRTPPRQQRPSDYVPVRSTDASLPAARPASAAHEPSRESLRSLMRAARRQMRHGSKDAIVEVRLSRPYTPRGTGSGSHSRNSLRHASCEFDVVFASATVSLASSPTETRRASAEAAVVVGRAGRPTD